MTPRERAALSDFVACLDDCIEFGRRLVTELVEMRRMMAHSLDEGHVPHRTRIRAFGYPAEAFGTAMMRLGPLMVRLYQPGSRAAERMVGAVHAAVHQMSTEIDAAQRDGEKETS